MPRTRPKVIPRTKSVPTVLVAAPVVPVAPSLPPVPAEGALLASTSKKYALPRTSLVKKRALAILALRAAGYTTKQIADELKVLPRTISTIMWRAGKAGFLKNPKTGLSLQDDPMDVIENELGHLAVENYRALLTEDNILERGQKSTKMDATLHFAKEVLFKKYEGSKEGVAHVMNALKIEIVMPTTGMGEARAGSMGGNPSFIDGFVKGEGDN